VLGDDCALLEQGSSVGRRGMCGMVFIFKVYLITIARKKCGVLHNCKLILAVILRETLEMYGGQSHVGTGFSLGTSIYPSQIQCTSASCSYFIHLSWVLRDLCR
jgi:hypothetical protein